MRAFVLDRPATALLLFSTAVQLLVVAAISWRAGGVDAYAFSSLDAKEYYQLALNLRNELSFSMADQEPFDPDFWRVPGYPLFMAISMLFLPRDPLTPLLANHALSLINPLLLFWIIRRDLGPARALLVAGVFSLDPFRLFYANWLLATTLFTTVCLLCWWATLRLTLTKIAKPWQAMLVGALCGIAILIRPISILFPLGLALAMVLGRNAGPTEATAGSASNIGVHWWKRLVPVGLVGGSAAIVVLPWLLRNYMLMGAFALSNQSGVVLAYFKATEVVLWSEGRTQDRFRETSLNKDRLDEPHLVWDTIDQKLQARVQDVDQRVREQLTWTNLAQGNRSSENSFAVSAALSRIGIEMLWERPVATAACLVSRMGALLSFPLLLAVGGMGQTLSASQWMLGAGYAMLSLLAAIQAIRRISLASTLVPLAIVICLLLATTPQLDPRFRVPLTPMLLYLAATITVTRTGGHECDDR
ncbi:MAG: ArnT family glycosyltransferase [Phycisphaerae bacterium]